MSHRHGLHLIATLLGVAACSSSGESLEHQPAAAENLPHLGVGGAAVIAQLDRLDVAAHDAQFLYHASRHQLSTSIPADDFLRSENKLNASLMDAWRAIPAIDVDASYVAADPLLLAMLDYQVELRRFLGPEFHTRVDGLAEDPGCAGDIVQDRLVWRYGVAAQAINASVVDHPVQAHLNRWAHQVVCLSDAQLSKLDYAMDVAFEHVAGRMRYRRLDRLIAPLVRLLAPLEILVLDVRKHRGHASRSWHWFERYRAELRSAVAASGWVGGDVLLWNRRLGVLVGFGPCAAATPECVVIDTLLDSLADPRGLGLGQCGLAAMVSQGPQVLPNTAPRGSTPIAVPHALAGGLRYVCPMTACQATSAAPGAPVPEQATPEQVRRLSEIWPGLDDPSRQVPTTLCMPRAADPQGVSFGLQSCLDAEFDSLLEGQNNPFDNYLACTMSALGVEQMPEVGLMSAMTGVPIGRQAACGALSDGGARTSSNTPPIGSQPFPKVDKIATSRDEAGKPIAFTYMYTSRDGTVFIVNSSGAGVVSIPRTPTPLDPRTALNVPLPTVGNTDPMLGQAAATLSIVQQVEQQRPGEGDTARQLLESAFFDDSGAEWIVATESGVDRYMGSYHGSLESCFDTVACSDACTSLGRLLSDLDACTAGLVDAMSAALGRHPREITRGRERVTFPRPPEFDVEKRNFGACFGASRSRSPSICGLIICGSGGVAVQGSLGCSCPGPNGAAMARTDMCRSIRCADGVAPDPTACTCADPGGLPDALGGGAPTWLSSLDALSLDACASSAPLIYDYSADPRSIVGRDGVAQWSRR